MRDKLLLGNRGHIHPAFQSASYFPWRLASKNPAACNSSLYVTIKKLKNDVCVCASVSPRVILLKALQLVPLLSQR